MVANMRTFTAVIERDKATGYYVGYIPEFPGAHSQAETLDELRDNLAEVAAMLVESKYPPRAPEFIQIR